MVVSLEGSGNKPMSKLRGMRKGSHQSGIVDGNGGRTENWIPHRDRCRARDSQ